MLTTSSDFQATERQRTFTQYNLLVLHMQLRQVATWGCLLIVAAFQRRSEDKESWLNMKKESYITMETYLIGQTTVWIEQSASGKECQGK